MSITNEQKLERGWFYIGKIKYFARKCDGCSEEYIGQGSNFCSRECSANFKIVEHEDGTQSVESRNRSTGHNYGKAISFAKKGKPNLNLRGSKHHNWQGGLAKRNKTERQLAMETLEYKEWRRSVFCRDNYQCVLCGSTKLEAHHINNWSDYPELRFSIDNGVTVCKNHHPSGRENELKMVETFKRILINKT